MVLVLRFLENGEFLNNNEGEKKNSTKFIQTLWNYCWKREKVSLQCSKFLNEKYIFEKMKKKSLEFSFWTNENQLYNLNIQAKSATFTYSSNA